MAAPMEERPTFGEEKLDEIIKTKLPQTRVLEEKDQATFSNLQKFCEKVQLIFHTVNNNEKWAVVDRLKPPELDGKPITEKPVDLYEQNWIVLGMFGGYRCALVQTEQGGESHDEIVDALDEFPNARAIIAIGVAYGFKPEKTKLGDVLVSKVIDGVQNIKYDKGGMTIFRAGRSGSRLRPVEDPLIHVFARGEETWRAIQGFKCTKGGRKSKVFSGLVISDNALVDNKEVRDKFQANAPEAIGGEMEGVVLNDISRSVARGRHGPSRELGVVVIKGVCDFADGTKEKQWQLTSAMAAASYAEHKLTISEGTLFPEGLHSETSLTHPETEVTSKSWKFPWKTLSLCFVLVILLVAVGTKYVVDSTNLSFVWGRNPTIVPGLADIFKNSASSSETRCGRKFGLPNLRHDLIGRKSEMEKITNYLRAEAVEVVTLHGAPGYGKSEMSLHIGHNEIEFGTDVYYINVKIMTNIKKLKKELIRISKLQLATDDDQLNQSLVTWSKLMKKRSLLILDNVDGYSWVDDDDLAIFQTDFIEVILNSKYSGSKLTVLITSQQKIKPAYKFRSLHLLPPSLQHCVEIFTNFVPEVSNVMYTVANDVCAVESSACTTRDKVESMCTLVGRVPKAVVILASAVSPFITIDYMIEELEDKFNALKFLDDTAKPGNSTLTTAFDIAFRFIQPEYKVCCLLLTRFVGFLSVASTEHVITPDLMAQYNERFRIAKCLEELAKKSFIETASYSTSKKPIEKYYFHTLTRVFLMNIDEIVVPRELLETFWERYFKNAENLNKEKWVREDIGDEDFEIIAQFINRWDYYSHILTRHLLHQMVGYFHMREKVHKCLSQVAINVALTNCKQASSSYSPESATIVLDSYLNIFTNILHQRGDFLDKLAMCEEKILKLYMLENENFGHGNRLSAFFITPDCILPSLVMYISYNFGFYHNFNSKCVRIRNSHALCNRRWKYNSKNFMNKLLFAKYNLELVCDSQPHIPNCVQNLASFTPTGQPIYTEVDSLGCRKVWSMIMLIELHETFVKRGDQDTALKVLDTISLIDLRDVDLVCHRSICMEIIIPFLNSTGDDRDWAEELWEKCVNVNSGTAAASDKTEPEIPENAEVIKPYKPLEGLNIDNIELDMEPIYCVNGVHIKLTPILEGKTSLHCFILKDQTQGCI